MALKTPRTDDAFLAWSQHFSGLITATPTVYGLSAGQCTAYNAVQANYATALAACDPAIRSKSSTAAKNAAKAALKVAAEQTAFIIYGQPSVTNVQKTALGLNVRHIPTPIPTPSSSPLIEVLSVSGWTVRLRLRDGASGSTRGKPPGTIGGSVFSFVGATAPTDIALWKFEGNLGRTKVDVAFSSTLAAGTKVWFTAFWFNGRKQSGPPSATVSTNLQAGGVGSVAA